MISREGEQLKSLHNFCIKKLIRKAHRKWTGKIKQRVEVKSFYSFGEDCNGTSWIFFFSLLSVQVAVCLWKIKMSHENWILDIYVRKWECSFLKLILKVRKTEDIYEGTW